MAGADLPPAVSLLDAGTPGLGLVTWLAGAEAVVLVDALADDRPPGTVRVLGLDEILGSGPAIAAGPHDRGVRDALLALDLAGRAPRRVVLVGCVAGSVETSTRLSPPVEAAVPRVVEEVRRQVARLLG